METALDTSNKTSMREYGAKILFAVLTLCFLWSSAGGDAEGFWQRQVILLVLSAVSIGVWAKTTAPDVFALITSKPSRAEINDAVKWGLGSALLSGGLLTIAVFFLKTSNWYSWDFLREHAQSQSLIFVPALLVTSYVLEFFMRGHLSDSWGRGSIAFLESVTIAVGLQSSLPFVLLLPMIFVWDRIAHTLGLRVAAISRVIWTLVVVVIAYLVAPYSS